MAVETKTTGLAERPAPKPLLPFDWKDRQTQVNLLLAAVVAGLIGYLYFRVDSFWYSYMGYLRGPDQMYSHAPLIPLVSLWLLWRARYSLFEAPRQTTTWAAGLVALALMMFFVGHKTELWRLGLISLILLLWSIPMFLWGWQVAKRLMFPVGFLLFAVPLNFVVGMTNPLKRMVSATAAAILNLIGVPVERLGAQIFSVPQGRFQLEVADACSGINSLIALVTLATVYGYVVRERNWQRWVLVLAAVPLAMLGNLVRVTSSGVVGSMFGQEAIGVFDKFSTFVVFIPAIAMLLLVDRLLDMDYRALKKRLFRPSGARSWNG
ncbi:MAG: exosortase/archaeosortase family protein [Verrucomicrobiae bacterium]|nr:exosortase/archaeosortase family protein [Verrucomicrobiae bacterium]